MVANNKKIDYNVYLTVFCPPIVSASLITLIILLFFSTYMKNWSTELIQSCMGLILLLLLLTGILLHLISLYTLFLSIFIYLIFSSSIPFLCYRGCIFLKSALDKSSHLLPMSPVAPTPTSPSPQSSPHPPHTHVPINRTLTTAGDSNGKLHFSGSVWGELSLLCLPSKH